ncbi:MAG: sugar phosphate isomerase/epimerase [Kiritimatiellae bacterium]|nr:sugar phosphate isomerase/epimerase [Kiritimatiellia bacterium]
MRLGIGSYTFTWAVGVPGHPPPRPLSWRQLLEKAGALRVGVVQIADNMPLAACRAQELAALQADAARRGLALEVGTSGLTAENLAIHLRIAKRLNAALIRMVIDTPDYHPADETVTGLLKDAAPECAAAGVRLAIENHDRFTARRLAALIERAGSDWIGVCLDTVNSFGALEGPEAVLDLLGPLTVNLHVKDFTVRRVPHLMGFDIRGAPAGEGRLDIPRLLERLSSFGRAPNAILELWTPPEPDLSETIRKEADWAERSIRYLRSLLG